MATAFYVPTKRWVSPFVYILTNICYCLIYYRHSSGCEMVSHSVLICISLITNAIIIYMCSIAIPVYSLVKCLFISLAHFLIYLYYYWILRVLSKFWMKNFYQIGVFFPDYCLSFHFLNGNFWSAKVLNFAGQFINFFLLRALLWV